MKHFLQEDIGHDRFEYGNVFLVNLPDRTLLIEFQVKQFQAISFPSKLGLVLLSGKSNFIF